MSDGVKLAANVFRPDKPGRFPVIMAFTPFSKDYYGQHDPFGCSVMTPFEGPAPGFWVPNGSGLADRRGATAMSACWVIRPWLCASGR
jgi:predicted acyl esterase